SGRNDTVPVASGLPLTVTRPATGTSSSEPSWPQPARAQAAARAPSAVSDRTGGQSRRGPGGAAEAGSGFTANSSLGASRASQERIVGQLTIGQPTAIPVKGNLREAGGLAHPRDPFEGRSVANDVLIRGVREQIVNRLRDDILSGRLAEGERLSEIRLARRFGVSRGPVRQALVQLALEGLVVARPNCGVRVAPSAPDSVRELVLPIRRTLETYALRLVYDDLGADDFRTWEDILDRMKLACRQRDEAAAVEQDIAFHRFLLERAGQPDLLAVWSTIVARIRHHFRRVHRQAPRGRPIDVYADHRALVEAFRGGDREAAVRALEAHIE